MTIYISGPMTGIPNENRPAFNAADKALRAAGFDTFNPANNGQQPSAPWSHHMRVDIAALMHCDSMVMLPGWRDSKGARLEHHIAVELGMTVHYDIDQLLLPGRISHSSLQTLLREQSLEDRFLQAWNQNRFSIEPAVQADQKIPVSDLAGGGE